MYKRILTVVMALAFVVGLSGMALASNTADVFQYGTDNQAYIYQLYDGNEVYSHQNANSWNYLDVSQYGKNSKVNLNQVSVDSYNWAKISQGSSANLSWLEQRAEGYNAAKITQDYYNKLVGAVYCGGIASDRPARQISLNGSNSLSLVQSGGGNTVGLYQEGNYDNTAGISQLGGNNNLGVYQYNVGGFNSLTANQTGGDTATICQTALVGSNVAVVNQ